MILGGVVRKGIALLLVVVLLVAACGGETDGSRSSSGLSRDLKADYERILASYDRATAKFAPLGWNASIVGPEVDLWQAMYTSYLVEDPQFVCEPWLRTLKGLNTAASGYKQQFGDAFYRGMDDAERALAEVPTASCW